MKEISGDSRLSTKGRLAYLLYNFWRGTAGYTTRLGARRWHTTRLEEGSDSPSRKCLNQFLVQELPGKVPIGRINILDVGCGSGYVRKLLADIGYSGSYTGLDVYEDDQFNHNPALAFNSVFVKSGIESARLSDRFDLILSNTVLEHIEDDKTALAVCDRLLKENGRQVHIVPSFWALFLYLWHGYRQYNPRRIRRLFDGRQYKVYRLGGFFSFCFYFFWVTVPWVVFRTYKTREFRYYSSMVSACNRLDNILPFGSTLYVVVAAKARPTEKTVTETTADSISSTA